MKRFIAKIHYEKTLFLEEKIVYFLLFFPKLFYYLAIKLRLFFYKLNILKTKKVNAFVISVGNITTGGTGKTPVCIELANYFTSIDTRNAILSRGYGGKLPNTMVNTISDGTNIFYNADFSGDEPYLLASNTQNTVVLTSKNRVQAAQKAIDDFGAEILILDDGFQHIKLVRDLNIMLVDGVLKFGNEKILPQGPLREPLSEIKRADAIIVMNKLALDKKAQKSCETFAKELENKYSKTTIVANFEPAQIYSLSTNKILEEKLPVYAFCGVGQPVFFFEYLREQGFEVVKAREYKDHHLYTADDIKNIYNEAEMLGAKAIITTEKDGVKIKAFLSKNRPDKEFFALKLKLNLPIKKLLKDTPFE